MAMRWEDERWIKLYTRDTVNWRLLPWQGRAVWPLVQRKLDGAGMMHVGAHGARGLAVLLDIPSEVVAVGLKALLEDGTLEIHGGTLLAPNFIEAQEARTSNAEKKRRGRERDRDQAATDDKPTESFDGVSPHGTARHRTAPSRSDQTRPDQRRGEEDPPVADATEPTPPAVVANTNAPPPEPVVRLAADLEPGQGGPKAPTEKRAKRTARAKPDPSPEGMAAALYLLEAIRSHTPDFQVTPEHFKGWGRCLDLALTTDARDPGRLRAVVDYAHRSDDPFWRSNLLSGRALRERFQALWIKAQQRQLPRTSRSGRDADLGSDGLRELTEHLRRNGQ